METPPRVRETDISGDVAQFLLSVRSEDLVTELVQNELDAGSRHTLIEFGKSSVVCSGNGRKVDDTGWKRLRLVKAVSADLEKRDGIGVKNHGLRVGFLWGDEIIVQSNGQETRLLLRGEKDQEKFDPAAWDYPVSIADTHKAGCRVTIPLREQDLRIPGRDGFTLRKRSFEEIEQLFDHTIAEAPRRFIGVVCPGSCNRYELELKHWRRGTFKFMFLVASVPGWKSRKLFRRSCQITRNGRKSETLWREEVHTFPIHLPGLERRNVPQFYRGSRGIVAELSWKVDKKGVPQTIPGKLRYPIEYPDQDPHSYSELGLNLSAPFSSDPQRHGTAEGVERNKILRRICEDRVPWLLRHRLLSRSGPRVLELLRNPDLPLSDRGKRIILRAGSEGALPAASKTSGKEKKRAKRRPQYKCVPIASRTNLPYAFLIPCLTWQNDHIDPVLAELCPPEFTKLHPRVPRYVVKTLCDPVYDEQHREIAEESVEINWSIFDESDALERLQAENAAGDFPWEHDGEWKKELSNPERALLYLEVLNRCISVGKLDEKTTDYIQQFGTLPNDRCIPTHWCDLSWSRWPVPKIPGVDTNIIHPSLASDKVFTGAGPLRPDKFDIDEALSGINWEGQDVSARLRFFNWLRQTRLQLKRVTWEAIRAYPIWPTGEGSTVQFGDYCEPRNPKITKILGDYIVRPPRTVRRFKRVSKRGSVALLLRNVPNEQEIRDWYNRLASFEQGRPLKRHQRSILDKLEKELTVLRSDNNVRSETSFLASEHRTIDRKGNLKYVQELHIPTETVKTCRLLLEDITGGRHRRLYQSLGARTRPSSDALERALAEGTSSSTLFYRRVSSFVRSCEDPERLAEVPCVRLRRRKSIYKPSELKLPSKRDFWGAWKVECRLPDLNPDTEENLVAVGVIDRVPNPESSREFFDWLADEDENVLRNHLPQVLRHFDHRSGPISWWRHHRWVKCLPVRSNGDRVSLVGHITAVSTISKVYLPDFPEIEGQLLDWDIYRSLALVEHPKVRGSIMSDLKEAGVQSLKTACMPPIWIRAHGDHSPAPHLLERVTELTSGRLRNELSKRLEEHHISRRTLKSNWFRILREIKKVVVADEVIAGFKLGHPTYRVSRPWAVSLPKKTVWIADGEDSLMSLYEVIAALIFKDDAPPHMAYVLRKAVSMDFQSRVKVDKANRAHDAEEDIDQPFPEGAGEDGEGDPRFDENMVSDKKRVHGAESGIAVPS
ncbi:MAG: hypothetical protein IID18_00950, partial [Nitrospinae bacterium]|nr:hypothetical protein [Nitrospinota bacterium]